MLAYLLGIETVDQLARDPLRGFLVENLVMLELMKTRLNQGLEPNLYYFRDNHKNEVDLIYKKSNQLIPVEIKSSQTFNPVLLKGIQYYQSVVGSERSEQAYLVYTGDHQQQVGSIQVLNYKNAHQIVSNV